MSTVGLIVCGVGDCTEIGAGVGTRLDGLGIGVTESPVGDLLRSVGVGAGGANEKDDEGGWDAAGGVWTADTGAGETASGVNENVGAVGGGVETGVGAKVTFLSNQLGSFGAVGVAVGAGVTTGPAGGWGCGCGGLPMEREEENAEPEDEGVEVMLGRLNDGAGLKVGAVVKVGAGVRDLVDVVNV